MKIEFDSRRCLSAAFNFNSTFLSVLIILIFSSTINSQTDTIKVAGDTATGEGNLNRAIQTVVKTGKLSQTVFKLELNSRYILSDSVHIPDEQLLTIVAPNPGRTQETAPPQILCSSIFNYPENKKYNFHCFGNITFKNIWLLFATTLGDQLQINLQFDTSSQMEKVQKGVFENVIFDYSGCPANASGAIGITTRHFIGVFKNCYWKNCTDRHFRYYGRAVSYPFNSSGWHTDSLTFENCTFANIGYGLQQEPDNYADNVKFNHCTFVNVVMFPLESGYWNKLSVTNCIFMNTQMYGYFPIEWQNGLEYSGTFEIDSVATFGFTVPFKDQDRRILFTNSSYGLEKWLTNWMATAGSIWNPNQAEPDDLKPHPLPMLNPKTQKFFEWELNGRKAFLYMNKAYLHDSTNPGFIRMPSDTIAIKRFLYHKWFDCCDTSWAYFPGYSANYIWPMKENLAYTNQVVLNAGMGNYPLGDLYRWFPERYLIWKAQQKSEDLRISAWLNTGKDPGTVDVENHLNEALPANHILYQNYPNPFNPETNFQFFIPSNERVRLILYDILGNEIAEIVNKNFSAGLHTVKFNGANLAAGVYFFRLTAGSFSSHKKLILMK